MSADDRTPPDRPQRQFVSKAIASLMRSIDAVNREIANSEGVSHHSRIELRSNLTTVTVILRSHRSDLVGMEWDDQTPFEDGPDEIISDMFDNDSTSSDAYSLWRLYIAATDMLEVASQLGLTAPVEQKTTEEHPDPI